MASRVSYKFIKHPEGDEKLPPQAVTILKELEAFGKDKVVSRDDLVAALDVETDGKANKLNARQPVERVIAFYQKRLAEAGYWEVHKAAPAAKANGKADGKEAPKGKGKVPAAEAAPEATAASMEV